MKELITADVVNDYIHIVHYIERSSGATFGELWFEKKNIEWLIDALRNVLMLYGCLPVELVSGEDHLKVFESGPEQSPVINVFNVRSARVIHGGTYARSMSRQSAGQLLEKLNLI